MLGWEEVALNFGHVEFEMSAAEASFAGMQPGRLPRAQRALHLVECSAVVVLKFIIHFERGAHVFVLHWLCRAHPSGKVRQAA